ncbi:MAG: terminase large subunit domain-containing protein [Candidatus Nitrosocosmicus sp.]
MLNELKQYSPEEILSCLNAARENQKVLDHINFKYYTPKKPQLEFHATGLVARERMFRASNRFGKSFAVSREGAMHLTGIYPEWWNGYIYTRPINMWAGGVASPELVQLTEYYIGNISKLGAIHPSLIVDRNVQKNIYYIRHSSGGISKLRIKTYEQRHEAWQAEKVDLIHLDEEPTQIDPKIYGECLARTARVCEEDYGMIMLSMTPLHGMTSLLLKFMDRPVFNDIGEEIDTLRVPPGEVHNERVFITATMDDDNLMPESEKKRLYASYDPSEREARTKGIPSLGSGLIYPISEQRLICDPFEIPEHWPRCYGMDFGWHNTAAIFAAHDQDNDVVYLYGEYKQGHLTPMQHTPHLFKMGAQWMWGAYDYAGENAGQDYGENVVSLYEKEGLKKWVRAEKHVSEGIYKVLQRMETDRLKIFSSLKKTLAELRMYIRDENGKVKKGDDHLLDALRYLIMSSLSIASVKPSVLKKQQIPIYNKNGSSGGSFMRF